MHFFWSEGYYSGLKCGTQPTAGRVVDSSSSPRWGVSVGCNCWFELRAFSVPSAVPESSVSVAVCCFGRCLLVWIGGRDRLDRRSRSVVWIGGLDRRSGSAVWIGGLDRRSGSAVGIGGRDRWSVLVVVLPSSDVPASEVVFRKRDRARDANY